jgi:hypothetical protein
MPQTGRKDPRAGGSLLAVCIIAGAIGGTIGGQPSVGFVAGFGAGLIILAFVWLTDRKAGK